MSGIYIGLSGFSYKPWQGEGRFYPPELKAREFLAYYSARYPAVEMDGTWYRMPSDDAIKGWIGGTPMGHQFSPKAHRQISHMSRLKLDAIEPLKFQLIKLAPLALAGKMGPMLIQLPPNLKRDDDRLIAFMEASPKNFSEIELKLRDGTTARGPESLKNSPDDRIRYAFEFRHPAWSDEAVDSILSAHEAAFVAAETDDTEPHFADTTDFTYARLRKSEYTDAELETWCDRLVAAAKAGKECYVYCKHEDDGSPWIWADALIKGCGELAIRVTAAAPA